MLKALKEEHIATSLRLRALKSRILSRAPLLLSHCKRLLEGKNERAQSQRSCSELPLVRRAVDTCNPNLIKMNRIAVAGGSGAVGKTFIEELQQTNHHIFILTRRVRVASWSD